MAAHDPKRCNGRYEVRCPTCGGSGAKNAGHATCWDCGGKGTVCDKCGKPK